MLATIAITLAALLAGCQCTFAPLERVVQSKLAVGCTNVKIPPNLCKKCHLRPHGPDGTFFTSYKKDIIDIDTPECQAEISTYIDLNPCDELRAKYFASFNKSKFAYERVAQFMYSVCEQCCDMVTVGSKPSEYWMRKKEGTLYEYRRGNSPAHLHFDICKMYPSLTRFTRPWWGVKEGLPEICPITAEWMASNYSKGWSGQAVAEGIPDVLIKSFGAMANMFGCKNRRVWQDCVRLESAQGRI